MSQEQTVFSQILQFISYDDFYICVRRHDGNKSIRRFSCWEQFLAMAFAQLTYRESLRDIEVCLAAHQKHLYRSGFRSMVRRSTLADANENRDWRIYADFAHSLIKRARPLYVDTDLGLDLDGTVYALDATTIDLCLSLFPWAPSRYGHGGVKLQTMIDIQVSIPAPIDKSTWLRGYQTLAVDAAKSCLRYPIPLRRVSYYSEEIDTRLVFLSNDFFLPALTVAAIYRQRWQVELFFKWVKQHLRIKRFFGTSPNSVKTQIWIAVAIYVLIAIIKNNCDCRSLSTQFSKFSPLHFSRKRPSSLCFSVMRRRLILVMALNN